MGGESFVPAVIVGTVDIGDGSPSTLASARESRLGAWRHRCRRYEAGDVLPTSRKMADIYDIAAMTAQRALRELQQMGLTYGVVGKGTFVHPEAQPASESSTAQQHPTAWPT